VSANDVRSEVQPARLSFRLALQPARLLRARERIRDYLRAYCDDIQLIDQVVLCVVEACTNAIRHSGSDQEMVVSLRFQDGDLFVAVRDEGHGFDVESFDPSVLPDLMATGGRGLYLIARMMDDLELRSERGLEVRMTRRAVPCRASLSFDAALGDGAHRAAETRTRSLLDEIGEAFVALDWEYRVLYANAAALRLFGRSEELRGHDVWEAFPSLAETALAAGCRQAMELGTTSIIEHESARLGWLEARIYPTQTGVSVYLREISGRKRLEAEGEEHLAALRERVRLSESQEAVNQLIHSTLGIDAIIKRALDAGSAALGAEAASVEMRESGAWFVRYQRGLSAEALAAELSDEQATLATRASQTKEPVVIEDTLAEPGVNVGIIGHYGIRSCIVVPLFSRGEVEGCLLFHYGRPHRFTSAAVDYAKKLGSTVSLALDNARLREGRGDAAQLRASLTEGRLGRLIAQSRVYPIRVLLVACLFEAAFLSVIGVAPDTREVYGMPGSLMALTVVIAGALAGSFVGVFAALFGGVVFYIAVADVGARSSPSATLISTAIWVAAAVVSSLLASGLRSQAERRRAAAVALARAVAEREAQIAERERIETLADDLAAERRLLLRAQQLSEALNAVNAVVNARLDPSRTMEQALRVAGGALSCEGGALVLREGRDDLVAIQVWNMRPGLVGVRLPLRDLSWAEPAFAEMRPAFPSPEMTAGEDRLAAFTERPAEGRIAVPLGVADEKLGALLFAHRHERGFYGQPEADFAENVGAIVSQALENARLYEEQRHVARTLQENLVHALPLIEGVEFGRVSRSASAPALVGGDFSDVFAIDESRVVVLIGDVAGKGLQAAGLTETVHTAVSSFALMEPSPGFVLSKTNELLLRRPGDEDYYVTAFLAVVDRTTGDVSYSSAGHPLPARIGGSPTLIEAVQGVPLGTFPMQYPTQHMTLQEGEGLVLYTDGVTEARHDGELYGEKRLLAALAACDGCDPRTLAEKLSEDATVFAGRLTDDLQILAFRLVGSCSRQPGA
jgi:PAS domain S-box-containing protein